MDDAALLSRFHEYIQQSGEAIDAVAFAGPSGSELSEDDELQFWRIAASMVLEANPQDGFAYLNLTKALLAAGDAQQAKEVLSRCRKTGYTFMAYYDDPVFWLALVEADSGNPREALPLLDECISSRPNDAHKLKFYKGTMFHEMGEFEDAIACYEESLRGLRVNGLKQEIQCASEMLGMARRKEAAAPRRIGPWMEWIHS